MMSRRLAISMQIIICIEEVAQIQGIMAQMLLSQTGLKPDGELPGPSCSEEDKDPDTSEDEEVPYQETGVCLSSSGEEEEEEDFS